MAGSKPCAVIFLGAMLMLTCCPAHARGSCRETKFCCPGRDSSCVAQKAPINAIIEDLSDKPCFCDHACLRLGDCCHDFKEACGVTDCQVSEWGAWSDCDADCGTGMMTRERSVIRHPKNGGHPCPELVQKRGCSGIRCETRSKVKAHRETAMILPARYATIRTMNASNDIRRNLRLRYPKDPAKENSHEYCVVFEVTKSKKACDNTGDEGTKGLVKGRRVCVLCEDAAMRKHLGYRCKGHGTEDKSTRWASLLAPHCHGRWIKKESVQNCPCHSDNKPDFIFV